MDKENKVIFSMSETNAVFRVFGELDHHSVREIRDMIDEKLIFHRPEKVVMDLSGVTFTDSAGLGMVLGRYTRIKDSGGELSLSGVSPEFMKILRLSGVDRMMRITEREKERK